MGFDHRRLKHGFQSTEINFEFRVSLAINLVMAASRAAVTTCIDYDNDKLSVRTYDPIPIKISF